MSEGHHSEDPRAQQLVQQLSRRDLMNATKEAVKELIQEQATAVGWWTIKTAVVAILGGGLVFALWLNGWRHGV